MRSLSGLTRFAIVTPLVVFAPQAVAPAAASDTATGLWMAVSGPAPSVAGTNWGRLILKDGTLTFHGQNEWKLSMSEIKRVSTSADSDRLIAVETFAGETYYIAILDANMLVDSPRKALQLIHRALRPAAAARRESRIVVARR